MYKTRLLVFILLLAGMVFAGHGSVIVKEGKYDPMALGAVNTVSRPLVFEDGILFTFAAGDDDKVSVSGSFVSWTEKIELTKNNYGIYYRFVNNEIKEGEYAYRFFVNGIWMNDPVQSHYIHDGYGTKITAFKLEKSTVLFQESPKKIKDNIYEFFLKDKGYKQVSWIGSKNTWDPYVDLMRLENGYWVTRIAIDSKHIFYKFYADGHAVLDPNNQSVTRLDHDEQANYVPLRRGSDEVEK